MSAGTMHEFQEAGHGSEHDYEHGSPHLKHPALRAWITAAIVDAVRSTTLDRPPRVLEVGAGHGDLTRELVAAGAHVVVTEMSRPSADVLRARFAEVDAVTVVHDPDGSAPADGEFDAVVYLSVLHHIPDYLAAVEAVCRRVRPGGAFITFQDPLWYPRQRRSALLTAKAIYLAWRLAQGELGRGLATTWRRMRGVYDESQPSDMVEYHVVRDGVDEQVLTSTLAPYFTDTVLHPYWSTQSTWGQGLGERFLPPNTFGIVASSRVEPGDDRSRPATA